LKLHAESHSGCTVLPPVRIFTLPRKSFINIAISGFFGNRGMFFMRTLLSRPCIFCRDEGPGLGESQKGFRGASVRGTTLRGCINPDNNGDCLWNDLSPCMGNAEYEKNNSGCRNRSTLHRHSPYFHQISPITSSTIESISLWLMSALRSNASSRFASLSFLSRL